MHTGQGIIKHPLPLLVPVNKIGDFSCICNGTMICSGGNWVINGSHIEFNDYVEHHKFEEKGFTFHESEKNGSQYTYALSVNASEAINNTVIFCNFEPQGDNDSKVFASMDAKLLVISSKYTCVCSAQMVNHACYACSESRTCWRQHNIIFSCCFVLYRGVAPFLEVINVLKL